MDLQSEEYLAKKYQYTHLKAVCLIALERCGIVDSELQFISDTANVIFYAKNSDQAYCVRICQQEWSNSELLGELHWLWDLNANTDLIIPKPVPTLSETLVQEIDLPNSDESFRVVVFHWIDGEIIGKNAETKIVQHVGRLMGALHNHAATFELPSHLDRERTDWRGMGQLMANMDGKQLSKVKGLVTESQIFLCDEAAQRAAAIINKIDDTKNFGLIHSDLHLGNCVSLTNRGIGILDFDDCQFAPFTCDLAITISDFDSFDERDVLQDALLQGYSEIRPLPPNYISEIEAFRIERRLRLIRWVSTWPSVDHFSFGQEVIDTSLRQCQQFIEENTGLI